MGLYEAIWSYVAKKLFVDIGGNTGKNDPMGYMELCRAILAIWDRMGHIQL